MTEVQHTEVQHWESDRGEEPDEGAMTGKGLRVTGGGQDTTNDEAMVTNGEYSTPTYGQIDCGRCNMLVEGPQNFDDTNEPDTACLPMVNKTFGYPSDRGELVLKYRYLNHPNVNPTLQYILSGDESMSPDLLQSHPSRATSPYAFPAVGAWVTIETWVRATKKESVLQLIRRIARDGGISIHLLTNHPGPNGNQHEVTIFIQVMNPWEASFTVALMNMDGVQTMRLLWTTT